MSSNECTVFKRLRSCRAVPIGWARGGEVHVVSGDLVWTAFEIPNEQRKVTGKRRLPALGQAGHPRPLRPRRKGSVGLVRRMLHEPS